MSAPALHLRPASEADAPSLLAIYRPYVAETVTSFELEPPTVEAFAARIARSLAGWAWLVAEVDGTPAGYAYGTMHRESAAYARTVETAIYLDAAHQGRTLEALPMRFHCPSTRAASSTQLNP